MKKAKAKKEEPVKTMNLKVDVAAWFYGELCRMGVVLGCSPEDAFNRFLTDTDIVEDGLCNWVQQMDC